MVSWHISLCFAHNNRTIYKSLHTITEHYTHLMSLRTIQEQYSLRAVTKWQYNAHSTMMSSYTKTEQYNHFVSSHCDKKQRHSLRVVTLSLHDVTQKVHLLSSKIHYNYILSKNDCINAEPRDSQHTYSFYIEQYTFTSMIRHTILSTYMMYDTVFYKQYLHDKVYYWQYSNE